MGEGILRSQDTTCNPVIITGQLNGDNDDCLYIVLRHGDQEECFFSNSPWASII